MQEKVPGQSQKRAHRIRSVVASTLAAFSALDAPSADGQVPPKREIRPESVLANYERDIQNYIKTLHASEIPIEGSIDSIVRLFSLRRSEMSETGLRPPVPSRALDKRYYPKFQTEYLGPSNLAGWPALRVRMKSKEGAIGTTAIRVSEQEIAVPMEFAKKIYPHQRSSSGDRLRHMYRIPLQLQGEHARAPILSITSMVQDKEVVDGTYAVGLGKTQYLDTESVNADVSSGTYQLTGFLLQVGKSLGLQNGLRKFRSFTNPESGMKEDYVPDTDTFVLIGDPKEWGMFVQRAATGDDALGQPVFINNNGGGFRWMGVIVDAGYISRDGSLPKNPREMFAPIYIVAGSSIMTRDLK